MAVTDIYNRIQERLDLMGVKKNKMLLELGLNKSYLSDMRAKNTMPASDTLVRIAKFLDTSVEYLIEGSDICGSISSDELTLLERYRSLDSDGQDIVRATIIQELRQSERKKSLDVMTNKKQGQDKDMVSSKENPSEVDNAQLPPSQSKQGKKQAQ